MNSTQSIFYPKSSQIPATLIQTAQNPSYPNVAYPGTFSLSSALRLLQAESRNKSRRAPAVALWRYHADPLRVLPLFGASQMYY